jgi:hypothetical protein
METVVRCHAVEIADDDPPSLTCTCGEEFTGESWQEAGMKFDGHVNEVEIYKDGER